jgi:hypothetical protein
MDTVRTHVESRHRGNCVQRVSRKFKTVLHNISCSQRYYQAIITLGELFYVSWRVQSGVFYCAVFHIGPKQISPQFKYRFAIATKDGEEYSLSCITHSYFENVNDIVRQGKCVMLHYSIVQSSCNDKGDLPFRMEISQVWIMKTWPRKLRKEIFECTLTHKVPFLNSCKIVSNVNIWRKKKIG